MLKLYEKKKPIKAEKFDGSLEMLEKYRLMKFGKKYISSLFKEDSFVEFDDFIVTDGKNIWVIRKDVFKRTYKECE